MWGCFDARAAVAPAGDNTTYSSAYSDGWQTGDNGGYNLLPWNLSPGNNAAYVVRTSGNNGNGGADSPPPSDIDTNFVAWGMSASSGATAAAVRPFVGLLTPGQSFQCTFDSGFVDSGGAVGFALRSGTDNRFEVYFTGGQSNYTIADGSGPHDSGVPFTDEGLYFLFRLTGPDTYTWALGQIGGNIPQFSGTLGGTPGSGIDNVRFFDSNAGAGASHEVFLNELGLFPEPSSSALMLLCFTGLSIRRRRR